MSKKKRPSSPGKVPPRGNKGGSRPRPAGRPAAQPARASGGQDAVWERRRRRRQQRMLAGLGSGAVIIVVVVLVIVKLASGSGPSHSTPVPRAVEQSVTSVPVSAMVTAAQTAPSAALAGLPSTIKAPPITNNGKPTVLYVGAEYCPYCAAERWPLVMALSKFGTFSHLGSTSSSSSDTNPNTPTLSFYGSGYSSPYLNFVGVETETRLEAPLQKLTPEQNAILTKYDAAPYVSSGAAGDIPFIDFDGQFLVSGAEYDSSQLANLTIERASQVLTSPVTAAAASQSKLAATSLAAQAIAGHLVGALCVVTHDRPANVCSQVPTTLKQGATKTGGQTSNPGK